jgi:predicted TIM-barrel fold metal-dependent hydrolase
MPPTGGESGWPEGDAEMLLAHIDFCGIDRVVVFPPFAVQMQNDMKKANRWALEEVRKHKDRFIPAGTIFPLSPDCPELLHMLHDEGVRLAKVHPSIDVYDISAPAATECYAKAEELGIALDFHTGPHGTRLSLTEPVKFDDIAWDYPNLKLVFEHVGGRTYFEEFMAILSNHRKGRIFGGLASVLGSRASLWYLGPERVMDLVQCAGAEKLVYGLDFPWNSPETNKQDIQTILSLNMPETAKSMILGGNLAELLSL